MTTPDVAHSLRSLGWLCRNAHETILAVESFQRGWNLGPALTVDGHVGPHTQAALNVSLARLAKKQPTASAHFSFSEWRCGCGGTLPGCLVVSVHRDLLAGLEIYRDACKGPVTIASGYRCPEHNKGVGGAKDSQHMYGSAADVSYKLADVAVEKLHRFAGIGRSARTHLVRHVDVRDVSGHNTTGGTRQHPTIWDYAQ